jgi:hypothetical protein
VLAFLSSWRNLVIAVGCDELFQFSGQLAGDEQSASS